ncbi:MAG: DUF5615 family PIN-like protein [Actinobacteria bacterium]|nr:DUF5615 family PIN-like protein [Actinomycetota bacterium]
MNLLLDQNLPFRVESLLGEIGWNVVHTRTLGMARATDESIILAARDQGRIVVSADRDFGDLLRTSGARGPSLVFLRTRVAVTAPAISQLLQRHLPAVSDSLEAGCIAVLTDKAIRVRSLPID